MSTYSIFSEELVSYDLLCFVLLSILGLKFELKDLVSEIKDFGQSIYFGSTHIKLFTVEKKKACGQPMIDMFIFNGDLTIEEASPKVPDYAIEITKNDSGDSGNQCYQRLEKFIYLKNIYKDCYDSIKKYLLFNIPIKNETNSIPWDIAKYMCKVNGIHHIKRYITLDIEIEWQKPELNNSTDTIENFLSLVNSTHEKKNITNNRVNKTEGNKYKIKTNLLHNKSQKENSRINDPNTGFVCAVMATIKVLDPEARFIINSTCGLYNKQIESKSKLWSCLLYLSEFITIYNNTGECINKNWSDIKLVKDCYFKKPEGEKLSSIYLHKLCEQIEHLEVMFHNHAGCERSSICINGQYFKSDAKHIPDLVIRDRVNKKIHMIEAKINNEKKISGARQQLDKSLEWLKKNIFDKQLGSEDFSTYETLKHICVYGGENHPECDVMFSMKKNGDKKWGIQNFIGV